MEAWAPDTKPTLGSSQKITTLKPEDDLKRRINGDINRCLVAPSDIPVLD